MKKFLSAFLSLLFATAALAQGPLNPPGAPAPTMKSLQEIFDALQKRSRISAAPFTITNDGVYVLEDNLLVTGAGVSGITIGAGVKAAVIDLGGFTCAGVPGTAHGVNVMGANSIVRIAHGRIIGFGGNGINASNATVDCEGVRMEQNYGLGALCGPGSVVKDSVFFANHLGGIVLGDQSMFLHGLVNESIGVGVRLGQRCLARDILSANNTGDNMVAADYCNLYDCTSSGSIAGSGVVMSNHCAAYSTSAISNALNGIVCGLEGVLKDTSASGNLGIGIVLGVNTSCLGGRVNESFSTGLVGRKGCVVKDVISANNGGDNFIFDDDCDVDGCTSVGSLGWGMTFSNRCLVKNFTVLSNATGGVRLGNDGAFIGGRCDSSTGPMISAGSNFVGRALKLTGLVPAATLEANGGDVVFDDSAVITPGAVRFGVGQAASVTSVSLVHSTFVLGSLVISNSNPQTLAGVSIDLSSFLFASPGDCPLGQHTRISGSSFKYAGTNCSDSGGIYLSGIIEDTRFDRCELTVDIGSIVRRCTISDTCSSKAGLHASQNCLVESCMITRVSDDGFASGYSGTGVKLSTNCIIRNCTVTSCERNGIEVGDNCLVMNNTVGYCGIKAGITNGATIYVRFGSSLVDGNVCTKSDIGINLSGTNNTIIRNKISGNTTAIVGGVGNDVAPMSPATAAANPFSNFP